MININKRLWFPLVVFAVASCINKVSERDKSEDKMAKDDIIFNQLELMHPDTNDGLFLWQIDGFVKFIKGQGSVLTDQDVKKFLEMPQPGSNYFPMLELIYADPKINIFFLIAGGSNKGLFMSVFKSGIKISEIDLWRLSAVGDFEELSEKVILDKRVNSGEAYTFQVFSNNYVSGYYNVNVLLDGKIEIEKVEVAEGDIP